MKSTLKWRIEALFWQQQSDCFLIAIYTIRKLKPISSVKNWRTSILVLLQISIEMKWCITSVILCYQPDAGSDDFKNVSASFVIIPAASICVDFYVLRHVFNSNLNFAYVLLLIEEFGINTGAACYWCSTVRTKLDMIVTKSLLLLSVVLFDFLGSSKVMESAAK